MEKGWAEQQHFQEPTNESPGNEQKKRNVSSDGWEFAEIRETSSNLRNTSLDKYQEYNYKLGISNSQDTKTKTKGKSWERESTAYHEGGTESRSSGTSFHKPGKQEKVDWNLQNMENT